MFYISSLLSKIFINSKRSSVYPTLQVAQVVSSFRSFIPPLLPHLSETPKIDGLAGHPRLSKVLQRPIEAEPKREGKRAMRKGQDEWGGWTPKKKQPKKKVEMCKKKLSKKVGCTNWSQMIMDADNMMRFFWSKKNTGRKVRKMNSWQRKDALLLYIVLLLLPR